MSKTTNCATFIGIAEEDSCGSIKTPVDGQFYNSYTPPSVSSTAAGAISACSASRPYLRTSISNPAGSIGGPVSFDNFLQLFYFAMGDPLGSGFPDGNSINGSTITVGSDMKSFTLLDENDAGKIISIGNFVTGFSVSSPKTDWVTSNFDFTGQSLVITGADKNDDEDSSRDYFTSITAGLVVNGFTIDECDLLDFDLNFSRVVTTGDTCRGSDVTSCPHVGAATLTGSINLYLTDNSPGMITLMNSGAAFTLAITLTSDLGQTLVFMLHDCRLTNIGATWENAVGSRNMQLSFEAFSKIDGSFFDITATAVSAEVPEGVPSVQIKENESQGTATPASLLFYGDNSIWDSSWSIVTNYVTGYGTADVVEETIETTCSSTLAASIADHVTDIDIASSSILTAAVANTNSITLTQKADNDESVIIILSARVIQP